jgi:hypothetical protein
MPDSVIIVGIAMIILGLGAFANYRAGKQKQSGWFEESDYDHVIEDFSWMPKELRKI